MSVLSEQRHIQDEVVVNGKIMSNNIIREEANLTFPDTFESRNHTPNLN